MGTKQMKKGILKPFRYFTNIIDGKETEMQIGFPTDVKHVAHIGWDGPSVTNTNTPKEAAAPTWMKDYHSAPLDSASFRSDRGGSAVTNPWASQEINIDTTSEGGDNAAVDSPPSPSTRRARRNRARGTAASSMDCTGSEHSERKEKTKKGIRKHRKKDKDKTAEDGSTCQDLPAVPKKSTRRKHKGSSEGSSVALAKDAGAAPEEEGTVPLPEVVEEEKGSEL